MNPQVPGANNNEGSLYASPGEALKKVASEYEYWSGKLTETSLQMCYALIGANWVVFGSLNGILQSNWAKVSLLLVVLALAANLVGAWRLSESLRDRISYGEENRDRWKLEFDAAAKASVAWPFTDQIDATGRWMRRIKAIFTLGAGVCFVCGAILRII